MIEKLRLKNATLKTHIKKVEVQLKHKEEMGDVLHYIDFHQLQIENKQVRQCSAMRPVFLFASRTVHMRHASPLFLPMSSVPRQD